MCVSLTVYVRVCLYVCVDDLECPQVLVFVSGISCSEASIKSVSQAIL